MSDAAKISPRVPSTLSSRSIGRWEGMILPGREDPQNLGQSEWDKKFGKIECEYSLYDRRRCKWDDVYLLRGLPNIYSPSLCPPPLPQYLRTATVPHWRCTWRPWSSVFGDTLGDWDRVNSEMHLESGIEPVWGCTCRPRSSELRRCTWRPWSIEFGDALWGCDRQGLEMHLQAMIEGDWGSTWSRSSWREAQRHCTLCWLMIMAWIDREGWLNFVFLGDGGVEHKKERDQRRWGKSSWETGT